MCEDKKKENRNDKESLEEDDTMNGNAAVKVDNNLFTEFLRLNKNKINAITPKNPTIPKDDEWTKETCWDDEYKEPDYK